MLFWPAGASKLKTPLVLLKNAMGSVTCVEATRLPTLTRAVLLKTMPFGLTRKTLPTALIAPEMLEGPGS